MEILLIVLLVLVAVGLGVVAYLVSGMRRDQAVRIAAEEAARLDETKREQSSATLLLQQMNELTRQMQEQSRHLNDSSRTQTGDIQKSIDSIKEQVTKHLLEVTKGVTEANQSSKQIFTIADQLRNLEKVLKHQKQRGNLGEASLELILSNVLAPTNYTMQYRFADGEIVDAVITTPEGMIPIDAKFSLDNYSRLIEENDDVRRAEFEKLFRNDMIRRIDETAKYVRPNEKTLPFAFMFIPAEGIYYDLLINEIGTLKSSARSLIDYAHDKKVVIVSPTTFAAYLQSVLYGFKAFKIEESAQQIRQQVGELQKHLKAYEEYHSKLGKSLDTTVNHFNASNKSFRQIEKDVFKITDERMGIEALAIDKTGSSDEE
jgi:DNA recombination protein RmuC